MKRFEKRQINSSSINVRENTTGTKTLTGYAVKWGKRSHVLGSYRKFREQFVRGAFTETLKNDDQRFLWAHDTSNVLGRTKNLTLRIVEDYVGLRFEVDLPDTSLGKDVYELIKRGDIDGVSFGFLMIDQDLHEPDDDIMLRTIKKAKLIEISAVTFPAYPDSKVSAKENESSRSQEEDLRKRLIIQTYL